MIPELRPMSTSELLDRTFYLYRNNFALFAGIAALAPALAFAVQMLAMAIGVPTEFGRHELGANQGGLIAFAILFALILLLIYLVATQVSYGATVHAVSKVHLGEPTSIRDAYRRIRPFWGRLVAIPLFIGLRLLGVGIVVGIAMVIPLLNFILLPLGVWWGVYIYTRCSLAGAACVLEGTSAGDSIARSQSLADKAAWRIFLILLLTGILGAALSYALTVPAEVLTRVQFARPIVSFTRQLGDFVGQTLAAPIGAIALTLVYYDQRIRKEAFDLEVMMQGLKQANAQPAATSASR